MSAEESMSFKTSADTMFVRVEHKNKRKFVQIKDIDGLTINSITASVVSKFQIGKAKGKKVYIHDHLNTRIHDAEELKFLLQSQMATLVLKFKFEQSTGRRSASHFFTSTVDQVHSYFLSFV